MDPMHSDGGAMGAPAISQDERTWGALAHGGAILGWLTSAGVLAFLVPLLILVIRGPASDFVAEQARESLNFQITMFIAMLVSFLLCFVLIEFPLLIIGFLLGVVWIIIATSRAANGELYRYPLCIHFIR